MSKYPDNRDARPVGSQIAGPLRAAPPIADSHEFDSRLGNVLSGWMDRRECGVAEMPRELVEAHPELAPRLGECLESLQLLSDCGLGGPQLTSAPYPYPSIPDFKISGQLGRGGMGIVYEATQISLDRPVAIKVLPATTTNPIAARRFQREAETAAALHHTHIVPIYAVGHHEGVHWYAMQRIDGKPLNDVLGATPGGVAVDEVVRIGIEAADALAYAHHHGVVHRDIKPANLLMEKGGHVWLADFGLARRDADLNATATGAMLGTPRYMSPEQVFAPAGASLDYRSDIYSLGATLYELVTGQVLFDGPTPLDVLQQIRTAEPAQPRSIRPSVPRDLEIVLQKCLAKEPKERYQSAEELAGDLRAIQDGRPIQARGVPLWARVRRRLARDGDRWKTAAAMVGLTVAVLMGGYAMRHRAQEARQGSIRISAPGGPYVAAIFDADDPARQDPVATTSLPMHDPVVLDQGSYLVRMAQPGRASQVARFDVDASELTRARYVDRGRSTPGIEVRPDQFIDLVATQRGSEWLARIGDSDVSLFDINEQPVWQISSQIVVTDGPIEVGRRGSERELAGGIPDGVTAAESIISDKAVRRTADENTADENTADENTADDVPRQGEKDTDGRGGHEVIDFGHHAGDGWSGNLDAVIPYYAKPQRIMRRSVDLDGDDRGDFVITGRDGGALAAVSHDGKILWARRVRLIAVADDASKSRNSAKQTKPQPIPSVIDVQSIEDVDGDDTADLVVNFARFEGMETLPGILTISGRTGELIAHVGLPAISVIGQPRLWPTDGTMVHRTSSTGSREYRGIDTLAKGRMRRSSVTWDYPLRWRNTNQLSNLPIRPQPQVVRWMDKQVIVSISDRTFSIWDPQSGKAVADAVKLPFSIACQPLLVRVGENEAALLFWSSAVSVSAPTETRQVGLWVLGESVPRWQQPMEFRWDILAAGLERSDLPLAADLDGDDCDEILIPACNVQRWGSPGRLSCVDAVTGQTKWENEPEFRSVEWMPERATVLGDFDEDGTRDIAVATLWGRESSNPLWGANGKKEEFALYLDLISGRDGSRIGFRKETFPASDLDKHIDIDFVCGDGDAEVEAAVVITQMDGIELDSMTFRFDLHDQGPATVIEGLARIGGSTDRTGIGFYRRRGGIDRYEPPAIFGIKRTEQPMRRMDSDRLVAIWTSQDGSGRLLLRDSNNRRLRAIDATTGATLWTHRHPPGAIHVIPVETSQGHSNGLLVQTTHSKPSMPKWIDAETGRERRELPILLGRMTQAVMSDEADPSLWLLAHSSYIDAGRFNIADRGLKLCHFRSDGSIVSQTRVLTALAPERRSSRFLVAWLRGDCDGDGVHDVVLPDDGDSTEVALTAISGMDGHAIWKRDLKLPMQRRATDGPWPLLCQVGEPGQRRLIVTEVEDKASFAVRMLSAETGQTVDSRILPANTPIERFRGFFSGPLALSLRNLTSSNRAIREQGKSELEAGDPWPQFAVAYPTRSEQIGMTRGWLKLGTSSTGFTDIAPQAELQPGDRAALFFANVDGSSNADRFRLDEGKLIRESDAGETWKVDARAWGQFQRVVEEHGVSAMAFFRNDVGDDTLVDLASGSEVWRGRAADRDSNSVLSPTLSTPLLFKDRGRWSVVQSNRMGVQVTRIGSEADSNASPRLWLGSSLVDNRLRTPLPVASPQAPTASLAAMISASVQAFFGLLLPLLYLYRLLRRRTYQLWYLLLAPLVALLSLRTWQHLLDPSRTTLSNVNQNEPWQLVLLAGTLSILSVYVMYRWFRDRNYLILGMVLFFSISMTIMLVGVPIAYQWLTYGTVHYEVGMGDVLLVLMIHVLNLSVFAFPFWSLARWILARSARAKVRREQRAVSFTVGT